MNALTLFLMSGILSAGLLAVSCSDDAIDRGPTIDEIEIIEKDNAADPEIGYDEAVEMAEVTDLMKQKAEDYSAATQADDGSLYNCVYVYANTLEDYADDPEKLAARISLLGFKGVYLSPGGTRLTTQDPWLKEFISTCTGLGMEVYATYYEDPSVFVSEAGAKVCLDKLLTYNRGVAYESRFAGVSADLEPHTIKTDIGLGWIWNTTDHNGVGGQNDNLLKVTIDRLAYADANLYGLRLQEAIWWNYQNMYNEGKVAYGDVNQFTEVCDWVTIMAYRNTTDGIWDYSEPTLKACTGEDCVSICVKTATNDEPVTTIMPNGWNALLETMKTLKTRGLEYECFYGLDMFQYEALETMWEWVTDNEYKAD